VDIEILAPRYKGFKETESFGNVRIRRFPVIEPVKNRYLMRGLGDYLKTRKFDLVHSVHYAYPPAEHGFRFARKNNIPHVLAASYHSQQVSLSGKIMIKLYNRFVGKNLLKNSDVVIPQNRDEEKEIKKITDCRCVVVPAPVNHKFFYPRRKRKSGKLVVGYAGILEGWKGAKIAFDICRRLEAERDDVRFLFVGAGSLEKELKAAAGPNFTFRKNLPVAGLAASYAEMDVLLAPTFYESFGRIIAEAMMCGTPVLSTRRGAVPDTVGSDAMLVDYGDWTGMEKKAAELLDSAKLRSAAARRAADYSRKYQDTTVAAAMLKLYNSLL
jgi:glycosyltransferase involved in cell wall biosynthesis